MCLRGTAFAAQEVAANMKAAGVNVIVPKPYPHLSSKRVLVMEFCDGFPVRDMDNMDKYKVDRHVLMDRICQSFAVQMHVNGFFNAGEKAFLPVLAFFATAAKVPLDIHFFPR